MHNDVKLLPYGVSNFEQIRSNNMYYVDKTMYLPQLEREAHTIIFIRPRRFGKSSFVSMMKAYYDKKKADQFEALFGGLYIYDHPTTEKHRYQVLHLDFSLVGGNTAVLEKNFNEYCNIHIDKFIRKYKDDYEHYVVDEVLATKTAVMKLNIIGAYAAECGIPLYLIVDEYDNFTNTVLNEEGHDVYYSITHASGFYRDVFKVFKGVFNRIFLTGVSPVTLDDLTSGFNIGMNCSLQEQYNDMLGLSTSNVREMITYYRNVGSIPAKVDVEAIIEEIKPWYDNYCFAEESLDSEERVFNTDMVLYYLNKYIVKGAPPKEMIDPNTLTDYSKMRKLINLDRLDGNRKGTIIKIVEDGEILGQIKGSFPAYNITKPEIFVSLLYYYGMLTMTGTKGTQLRLGIPNNNVRKQYYDYLLDIYREQAPLKDDDLQEYYYNMAFDGRWEDAMRCIADNYKSNSSVRSAIQGERNIQGFFAAMLSLNGYYLLAPEMEFNHGYCDFFLMPDHRIYHAEHSYIVELKYLPASATAAQAEAQWGEAVEQIHRYAVEPRLQAMLKGTTLHKVILQLQGPELTRLEELQ